MYTTTFAVSFAHATDAQRDFLIGRLRRVAQYQEQRGVLKVQLLPFPGTAHDIALRRALNYVAAAGLVATDIQTARRNCAEAVRDAAFAVFVSPSGMLLLEASAKHNALHALGGKRGPGDLIPADTLRREVGEELGVTLDADACPAVYTSLVRYGTEVWHERYFITPCGEADLHDLRANSIVQTVVADMRHLHRSVCTMAARQAAAFAGRYLGALQDIRERPRDGNDRRRCSVCSTFEGEGEV